ncbi:HD domain-containing phosphohydrolase [Ideonella livida]|uniref:HD-GYP domain-containing protein n=1 Tax=Ideonella livida TaxID=2707176 RepID=A0A7C9TKR5_9BURK|nr:HD domain-containing phosphohydrolase [Ideonella livida]NDY90486.1 hypothetical protein [Ideonella livida]
MNALTGAGLPGRDGGYGDAATQAMGRLLVDFQRMQKERDQALVALQEAYQEKLQLAMATEVASEDRVAHLVRVGCVAERLALLAGVAAEPARCLRNAALFFGIGVQDVPLPDEGMAGSQALEAAAVPTGPRSLGLAARHPLELGTEVAYAWRERWDGAGLPEGLGGGAIPLSARLAAVANVLDGWTQPSRGGPMPGRLLWRDIDRLAGRQLDPSLVALTLAQGSALLDWMAQLSHQRPSLAELARNF